MPVADLGGTPVHYEDVGGGTPLLVLHGWVADHQYVASIIEPAFESRPGWRRIYPDLPGRGRTPPSPRITSPLETVRLSLDFIDEVLGEEPFAVAGNSYGGLLARAVLHERLDRVLGVLLIAPSVKGAGTGRDLPTRTVLECDESLLSEMSEDELERGFGALVVQDRKGLTLLREHFYPAIAATDMGFLEHAGTDLDFGFDVDDHPTFTGPALFLLGRQDDVVGYRDALDLERNYLHLTVAVLDRAGHFLAGVERVDACRALINDWLDRLDRTLR